MREDDARPAGVIRFDTAANRTYHYWHVCVPGVQPVSEIPSLLDIGQIHHLDASGYSRDALGHLGGVLSPGLVVVRDNDYVGTDVVLAIR